MLILTQDLTYEKKVVMKKKLETQTDNDCLKEDSVASCASVKHGQTRAMVEDLRIYQNFTFEKQQQFYPHVYLCIMSQNGGPIKLKFTTDAVIRKDNKEETEEQREQRLYEEKIRKEIEYENVCEDLKVFRSIHKKARGHRLNFTLYNKHSIP